MDTWHGHVACAWTYIHGRVYSYVHIHVSTCVWRFLIDIAIRHVYRQSTNACAWGIDMSMDLSRPEHRHMADMYVNMCIDMYIDLCINMCID